MANRLPNNQSVHDRVIEAAASRLDSVNYDIYKNPGKQKNAHVGNNYPDIILTKKGERSLQFIIEVETEDSVNLIEATNQWKRYSTRIKASFYILVPVKSKNLAISLCKQIGISARFGTYQVDSFGKITNISYE
jgi:hypothetical protein